jgi:excisionase family DNA binding protein
LRAWRGCPSPPPGGRLSRRARTAGESTYTVREAADRLGVSYDAVYDHYADFGGFKVGRRILLPRSAVDGLLAGPPRPAVAVVPVARLVTVDELVEAAGRLSAEDRLRLAGRLIAEVAGRGGPP